MTDAPQALEAASESEPPPRPLRAPPAAGPVLRDFPELRQLVTQVMGDMASTFEPGVEELTVRVRSEDLHRFCQRAKEDERLALDYLRCLSGVDWPATMDEAFRKTYPLYSPPAQHEIELVYHLYSMRWGHKLTVKTRLPKEQAAFPSVVDIWKGADWHEREAAEMFGISFAGHPHLVPLLLVEGLEEHPLLKAEPLAPILESYDA